MSSATFRKKLLGWLLRPKGEERSVRHYLGKCAKKWEPRKVINKRNCSSGGDPNIIRSTYPDQDIPDVPFHDFIFQRWGEFEDKVAILCGESGKQYKFKEMYKYSKNLAASLQSKLKLQKGDFVATVLPNSPDYPIVYLASSMTGVIATTVNPIYTPVEISYQLKEVQAKGVFTVPEIYEKCKESCRIANLNIPIIVLPRTQNDEVPKGAVSYSELLQCSPSDLQPVNIDPCLDVLILPYSSGTSGLPKGVMLTHRNIVANLAQLSIASALKTNPDPETKQMISLAVLPMFHIYGMIAVTFDSLRLGDRLVSLPRFDPKVFLESILKFKVQVLYLVPPLMFFLEKQQVINPSNMTSIRHVVLGAAPCGAKEIEQFLVKFPKVQISQGYGMTETSPLITMSHIERLKKFASAGHPIPSTFLKIIDIEDGKSLTAGNSGHILVKGPQVMKGYFNREKESQESFDEEGWLRTGDIGYYDDAHDFYIVDRIKELIKVKGFQVAPAELEEFLRRHPKILDAGVVGISDPELGQAPRAFVVLKPGQTATEEEIKDYIKSSLSSYKNLSGGVRFVAEIPKSSSGKIIRRLLLNLDKEKS